MAVSIGSDGDRSAARLAAEADALSRETLCDGTDRHVLGWSGRTRAFVVIGGVLAVLLLALVGQFAHFGFVAVTFLGVLAIGAAMSTSVWGDQVLVSRFGSRSQVPLASVGRVRRYSYRGNLSLRLLHADGEKAASLPVSALGYRMSTAAARHLLRYLDRPDVVWEPGAWETLSGIAGIDASHANSADEHVVAMTHSGPRGSLLGGKPLTGWTKALLFFTIAIAAGVFVFMLVLVPITWHNYQESQRIQHGPQVLATLQSENITSTSGRSGTHYTTHFHVIFTTQAGEPISAVVNAHGRYNELPYGYEFGIRYDPHSPSHAELPGAPNTSLTDAVLLTAFAGFVLATIGGSLVRGRQVRRRARAHPLGVGSSFDPDNMRASLDKLQTDMAGHQVDEIKPALETTWKASTGGGELTEPALSAIAQSIADGKRVALEVKPVKV